MPAPASFVREDDLDPSLARRIGDIVLFGKSADLQRLLDDLGPKGLLPDPIRRDLESLHFFRLHYASVKDSLPEALQERVVRYDADWTMILIQKLHRHLFEAPARKRA